VSSKIHKSPQYKQFSSLLFVLPLQSKYLPQHPVLQHTQPTFCAQYNFILKCLAPIFQQIYGKLGGAGGGGARLIECSFQYTKHICVRPRTKFCTDFKAVHVSFFVFYTTISSYVVTLVLEFGSTGR
jgi:hypothetical protein